MGNEAAGVARPRSRRVKVSGCTGGSVAELSPATRGQSENLGLFYPKGQGHPFKGFECETNDAHFYKTLLGKLQEGRHVKGETIMEHQWKSG